MCADKQISGIVGQQVRDTASILQALMYKLFQHFLWKQVISCAASSEQGISTVLSVAWLECPSSTGTYKRHGIKFLM